MDQPLLNRRPRPKRIWFRFLCVFALGIVILLVTFTASKPLIPPLKLRIYTHNIRYDNKGRLDKDELPWDHRKSGIIKSIDFNTGSGYANVVNLQEVLVNQLEDILDGLGDEWTYFGVGRTDGKDQGEFAPILFKKSEWNLEFNETFWLSPTPEKPSIGWDAALERILTKVTLRSKTNPLVVANFFNTHFDHQGSVARAKSTELIVQKLNETSHHPSFLAGDLNTEPTDAPYSILAASGYHDSRVFVDPARSYGESTTFTGFDRSKEEKKIIDYIWAPPYADKENGPVAIKRFGILANFWKNEYISDHRPVVADFEIHLE